MNQNNKESRPWKGIGYTIVIFTILLGIAYIIYQWEKLQDVSDSIFVGILMANTYAIYRFTLFLKGHLINSAEHYNNALVNTPLDFNEESFISEIFNPSKSLLSGFMFGSIFLLAVLFVSPWGETNSELNLFLGGFLMLANILTGMSLFSLFVYFRYSLKIGSHIEVDLWDRSNPAITALIDTNRFVVLATAFAACAGITSIIFSKFTLDYSIIVFSVFSISLILLTYIIPLIPVTTQIRRKKKQTMEEISKLIQNEYTLIFNSSKTKDEKIDIKRFESLNSVYKSVKSVRAFPPVGERSINTAISVTALTMLPSLIDFVLKTFSTT